MGQINSKYCIVTNVIIFFTVNVFVNLKYKSSSLFILTSGIFLVPIVIKYVIEFFQKQPRASNEIWAYYIPMVLLIGTGIVTMKYPAFFFSSGKKKK